MEKCPDGSPGGEGFEDFVDAQLNMLRERLVMEYQRRAPSLCIPPGPPPLPRALPPKGATLQEISLRPDVRVMSMASVERELASRTRSGEIEIEDACCEVRSSTQAMTFPGATRPDVAESPDIPNQVEEMSSDDGFGDSSLGDPEDDCSPRRGSAGRTSSMRHGSKDSHVSQVSAPPCMTSLQVLSKSTIFQKKSGIRKTGILVNEPLQPHKTWQHFEADEVKGKVKKFRDRARRRSVGQRNFMQRGRSRTHAALFPLNFGSGVMGTSTPQDTLDPVTTSSSSSLLRAVLPSKLKAQSQLRDPNSNFRVVWDIAGALFIVYDIISIPLGFFDVDDTAGLKIMLVLSLFFWLVDIPLNFLVGFHRGGGVVYNYWVIARRYMKSWLFLDLFLVSFDTFLLLFQSQEAPTGGLRVLRTMRVMRSLRVMRMAKLPQLLSKLQENIQSEYVTAFLGISELMGLIILINHVIACAWYGLSIDNPESWVSRGEMTEASKLYLYVTSMHWSLTQFTPASMEIVPNNEVERTFNVVVIVFAMVVFSSFVSRITNTMSHLRSINIENTKQYIKLQNYFRRNDISVGLCIRVRRHLDIYIAEKRRNIKESDIPLLQHLSAPLRVELHYEMFAPAVRSHPFFRQYDRDFVTSMYKIAHQATSHTTLSAGDILFNRGDVSSRMYIMPKSGGDIQYTLQKVDRADPKTPTADEADTVEQPVIVEPGSWLSEAALWADSWYHHGEARALTFCSLVTISVDQFHVAIHENKVATEAPAHYAGIFIDYMNNISISELTDLPISGFDIQLAVEVAWLDT